VINFFFIPEEGNKLIVETLETDKPLKEKPFDTLVRSRQNLLKTICNVSQEHRFSLEKVDEENSSLFGR
jgi:hypothetical protein